MMSGSVPCILRSDDLSLATVRSAEWPWSVQTARRVRIIQRPDREVRIRQPPVTPGLRGVEVVVDSTGVILARTDIDYLAGLDVGRLPLPADKSGHPHAQQIERFQRLELSEQRQDIEQ